METDNTTIETEPQPDLDVQPEGNDGNNQPPSDSSDPQPADRPDNDLNVETYEDTVREMRTAAEAAGRTDLVERADKILGKFPGFVSQTTEERRRLERTRQRYEDEMATMNRSIEELRERVSQPPPAPRPPVVAPDPTAEYGETERAILDITGHAVEKRLGPVLEKINDLKQHFEPVSRHIQQEQERQKTAQHEAFLANKKQSFDKALKQAMSDFGVPDDQHDTVLRHMQPRAGGMAAEDYRDPRTGMPGDVLRASEEDMYGYGTKILQELSQIRFRQAAAPDNGRPPVRNDAHMPHLGSPAPTPDPSFGEEGWESALDRIWDQHGGPMAMQELRNAETPQAGGAQNK
jgi:hypothetical protein